MARPAAAADTPVATSQELLQAALRRSRRRNTWVARRRLAWRWLLFGLGWGLRWLSLPALLLGAAGWWWWQTATASTPTVAAPASGAASATLQLRLDNGTRAAGGRPQAAQLPLPAPVEPPTRAASQE